MENFDIELIYNKIKLHYGLKNNSELANFLGVKPQAISNSLERNQINWNNIITKCENMSIDELLGRTLPVAHLATGSEKGIPLIPIEAIAGIPAGENIGIRFIDCAHYVIPEFTNLNVEYMIRVSGSSMYPKYSNGDILACRRIHDVLFFQWGKIYVIDSSQGPLVKRVFQDEDPERILLVSDNKEHYPPFSIPKSDIRSLSIVVGVIRLE